VKKLIIMPIVVRTNSTIVDICPIDFDVVQLDASDCPATQKDAKLSAKEVEHFYP